MLSAVPSRTLPSRSVQTMLDRIILCCSLCNQLKIGGIFSLSDNGTRTSENNLLLILDINAHI